MNPPSVLLFGATGNIGRAFIAAAGDDRSVVAVGSPRSAEPGAIAIDITGSAEVAALIARTRPDVVVHLASVVGGAAESDPDRSEAVNVRATETIARAARENGASRLVFASTAAVYGDRRQHPVGEADDVDPSGVYADTKLRAESVLAESVADGFAVDTLRIFNVFGPGLTGSLVSRLLGSTEGDPVTLAGLDGFVRDYVHVADVADALWAAADSTDAGHRILNVGRGLPVSNRELVAELSVGHDLHYTVGPERASYSCARVDEIERALGWTARRGLLD